ncbi:MULTISPECIES: RsmE family RNA methyltransferase [unclassified Myxococcus]|uniref:RsmE family RNA methyltransferase n=1 Tax=unclassified Myxococcus TaxID=2648731 RepID=UPI001E4F586E|nr:MULTISPECIES: RsmE family RNA methyltransferase [unclassified Myxococcus]
MDRAPPRPRRPGHAHVSPPVASLGVDRVILVNAARVEKSYFDSKVMADEFVHELLVLGLEQARDKVLPEILVRSRFRPFIEDELDALCSDSPVRLIPHPPASTPVEALAPLPAENAVLAIGPEGGWVPFEVELIQARGFTPFSLGPRILRVEVAVPLLLGQLALLIHASADVVAFRREPRSLSTAWGRTHGPRRIHPGRESEPRRYFAARLSMSQ